MYYDTALAAPALADNANSALILGMGTGTYARQLKQYYPKMNITGVEIDQKITDLAGEYFDEPADIPVTTYDGRAWLAASHDKYDVIMVDAYQDITIPFQMSSTEFFTMVREHLNPGGVMVVNMNMISDGQGSINEALSDTIASVFGNGNTLTADVPNTTNRELFAKKPGSGSEENSMQQASKALNLRETTYERTGSEDLEWYMEEVASRFRKVNEPDSASTILTDDKAPVEVLGMHAIDQIIADEAGPYRQIRQRRRLRRSAARRAVGSTHGPRMSGRMVDFLFGLRNQESGATPPGSLSRPRVQGKQPSDCDIQRVIRNDAKN